VNDTPLRLFLVVLLIAVNGFFAAAEVSLVAVRQSRLRQMAAEGHAGAQAALNLLANPGRLLSVTQIGVTLASLGLGWAGEDTVYRILSTWVSPLISTPVSATVLHGVSLVAAFLIISYFHVVMIRKAATRLTPWSTVALTGVEMSGLTHIDRMR
jgi:putative hemolysin